MLTTQDNETELPAFIADCHLGKLAKYLRLMGFDTLYFPQMEDNDLIALAIEQNRIILTRDRALSERPNIPVLFLEHKETAQQLRSLIRHYQLTEHPVPFSRCIVCNTPLQIIDKSEIIEKVPEKVQKHFSTFEYCNRCDRIYWKGDHYRRMQQFLENICKDEEAKTDVSDRD